MDWRITMHANVFWQFSRNITYLSIPGKLSEDHLHAWLFSNPCGIVLVNVKISSSPDLRVQHMIIPLNSTVFGLRCTVCHQVQMLPLFFCWDFFSLSSQTSEWMPRVRSKVFIASTKLWNFEQKVVWLVTKIVRSLLASILLLSLQTVILLLVFLSAGILPLFFHPAVI